MKFLLIAFAVATVSLQASAFQTLKSTRYSCGALQAAVTQAIQTDGAVWVSNWGKRLYTNDLRFCPEDDFLEGAHESAADRFFCYLGTHCRPKPNDR